MSGHTIFVTYNLVSASGYSKSIHCNTIQSLLLTTQNPYINEIFINFPDIDDFKFLSDDFSDGSGFTATNIEVLVQLVNNSGFTNSVDIRPTSDGWKVYDVTTQTSGHTSGLLLSAQNIVNTIYKVSLFTYDTMPSYNLDYLSYPAPIETNKLCFGDETYFLGNVTTDIEAIVYTTELSINLPLNEFNSTTNATWDGVSPLAISEIGIYAEVNGVKELVGIGKINSPVLKDSTIARTLVFAIDF